MNIFFWLAIVCGLGFAVLIVITAWLRTTDPDWDADAAGAVLIILLFLTIGFAAIASLG